MYKRPEKELLARARTGMIWDWETIGINRRYI